VKQLFNKIKSEIFIWIEFIFSLIPGFFGILIRRIWYSYRFKSFGNKNVISTGCQFISPKSVSISSNVTIGKNSFFSAENGSIKLGKNVAFNTNVHINSSVGGNIFIGDNVLIGPNVIFRTANHNFDKPDIPINQQGHNIKDIIIEDNVWIAANCVIIGGITIKKGSVVGAGSVVNRDVEPNTLAAGTPAKIIRKIIK